MPTAAEVCKAPVPTSLILSRFATCKVRHDMPACMQQSKSNSCPEIPGHQFAGNKKTLKSYVFFNYYITLFFKIYFFN